ncbi:wax ester/triacylglycerol synthase domain-containing protein [Streptomyces sp. NPDC056708]|uniref:wax ester/triacylglycerol synthase domain-containing protein n=1 Tax=unclassified Streptomyces TaxID=2593676 RepID=UPI0036995C3F
MTGKHQLAVGWAVRFRGEPPTPDELRRHLWERLAELPTLTHCIQDFPAPRFVPASDLDPRRHVRGLTATAPLKRWQDCVQEVLGRPLPTAPHPPWDLWLIHGYTETPEYVLVFRIHHAMEDGAGHHYVLQTLFTPRRSAGSGDGHPPRHAAGRVSLRGVLGVVNDIAHSFRGADTWRVLRRPPTGKLSAAFCTVGTRRLLTVSRALDTDVSAVFLTALTGAMRAVALAEGEPLAPLPLSWPLSTRTGSERGAVGNFLTMLRVELPCDEPCPLRRLSRITRQLSPGNTERRIRTSLALMRLAPRPVTHWTLRRLMSPRHVPVVGTYFPTAMPQPSFGNARLDGALGLGAPLPGQLCHLTLLRRRTECELSVVHDGALPQGRDIPQLWLAALQELEARI